MKLTANFSLVEMTKSDTALRYDIDNTPDAEQLENLTILCECVLQPVRERFGMPVKVNSGFRSAEVNTKVGGSKTSDHCRGMAADIEIPGLANAELAQWIVDNLSFRQVILEFTPPASLIQAGCMLATNPGITRSRRLPLPKKTVKQYT
jgi:zinc D-Ala-D-Ala carboxypeptidase